ncbi:cell wall assembly protein [Tenacibaculum holothuriorum]|uniref:Cell wall assembly protein n=1 Tax=Tenacibaculum holothuriorum TaxID=1635173 RepID=A0A1Y2PFS9_9FLAO|nr:SMI1/KNR4 family protein [Tenacibaculum holothuriorum]OSY89332.1 cell wall assembly protein [Tenacibaculum holothuriorum]
MKRLFKQLSESAIRLGDIVYAQEQINKGWIGNKPASNKEIKKLEESLALELPEDYKELIRLTNGFTAPNAIEPNFLSIEKVDYLRNIDQELIKAYRIEGLEQVGKLLEESILIGGLYEEQHFLLIPPNKTIAKWRYWKFANWIPGEEPYENLRHYFKTIIRFNQDES